VEAEDGLVEAEDGLVEAEDGLVEAEDGLVKAEDGLVEAEDGLVEAKDGGVCGDGGRLADVPGGLGAVPVVPVVGAVPEDILILEVGETTLVTLPVIWFSLHPVKPCDIFAVVVPGPVAPVMVPVGSVHSGSNPPLVAIIVSWSAWQILAIGLLDQILDEAILLPSVSLVQVDQPAVVGRAQDLGVSLSNILIGSSQENALNLLSNIGDDPAVRAVVGVLGRHCCKGQGAYDHHQSQHLER